VARDKGPNDKGSEATAKVTNSSLDYLRLLTVLMRLD
jgi:hypothetical protein